MSYSVRQEPAILQSGRRIGKPLVGFALMLLLGAATPDQAALTRPVTQEQLLALDRQVLQAIVDKDISKLRAMIAPDYIHVHGSTGKTETRESYLEFMRAHFMAAKLPDLSERSVKIYNDDTALILGRMKAVVAVDGKTINQDNRFVRVYVRVDGQWLLASSQSSAIK